MRCRDALNLSTTYLDGELDPRRSSAVRGHLRTCKECARAMEEEARVRAAAAGLDAQLDPPVSLWADIEARLAAEEISDSSRSRLWIWWPVLSERALYAIASATAAVLLVLWLLPRGQSLPERLATVLATAPVQAPAEAAPRGPTLTHQQAREIEIAAAEQRYQQAIAELTGLLAEERPGWTGFRERTRELAAHREAAVAVLPLGTSEEAVRASMRLHAVYRDELEFLSAAVLAKRRP
jgi:anti-sigma factor RsiW